MEIIKLNLIPNGVNPTCHCSQYDEGRVIRIELFDGLTPYTLQSGDTVTLNVRKPDNTIVTASVTATQGNKYVDIVTTEQICACVGYNLCDLTITNGSVDIGTLNFIMAIERDVLADGIPSQSVIEDLDELVQEAVGDNYYTKAETDTLLNKKADLSIVSIVNDISESTKNLWKNHDVNFTNYGEYDCPLAAGTYTITVTEIITQATQTKARVEFYDSNGNRISTTQENVTHPELVNYYVLSLTGRQGMPTQAGSFAVFTTTTPIAKVRLYSSNTASDSIGKAATWKGLQIETGYVTETSYVNPYTAKDDKARKALSLLYLSNKKVVCFGDSIIGNYTAPTDIPTLIGNKTGATCINVGFGGTRLTDNSEYGARGYFSFCKLVEAVVAGNFTAQETALQSLEDPDGLYRANLTKLESINFNNVDIVTFEQCTNDYYGDIYVTREGYSGNLIFDNAMRYCLDTLLTAFPNLQVVVIGPIYRRFSASSDSNNYANTRGFTLIDFKNKMQEIAQEYNLQFIDDYYIGINKFTHAKFLSDGTHPTEQGRELIATNISNNII